jgi:2,4'-dihydroxyacetophenone dioxygenase
MNQMTLPKIEPPAALHRAASDLPFVTFLDGLDFQLLQASVENGLWVVRTRFQPGVTIATHRHTGEVFAVTFAGSWRYLEYPEVNTAGSHLYEPAGSEHTLHVPASNTEVTDVWFAIRGANLNLDEQGNVASVWDATFMIETYLDLCANAGYGRPEVIGLSTRYAPPGR